jgi:hypothetical protein
LPRKKITFDTVQEIGLTLPGVEVGTSWGSPALKVRGQMLACIPSHKSAEPDSLVVRIDFDQRAGLIEEAPDKYYLKDHYVGYPAVLVRLPKISADELRDLLNASLKFVTTKKRKK